MTYVLQHRNPHDGSLTWFLRLGDQWPHHPERRLIDGVTSDKAQAKTFAAEEEAREVLCKAGIPPGWSVEENL